MVPLPPLHRRRYRRPQHPQRQLPSQQYQLHGLTAQGVDDIVQRTIPLMIEGRRANIVMWRRANLRARRAGLGARPQTHGIPEYLESVEPTTFLREQLDLENYDLEIHQPPRSRRRGRHQAPRERTRRTPSQSHHRRLLRRHIQRRDP